MTNFNDYVRSIVRCVYSRSLQAMGEVTSLALRGEGHMVRMLDRRLLFIPLINR
jgi:hypothetical protein